ncbi:hypothetical protein AOLI_G00136410 [Acnodon oligacanthus]
MTETTLEPTMVEDVFDESYREKKGPKPPMVIVWRNVVLMSLLHLGAVYGLFLVSSASPLTLLWAMLCFLFAGLGITAGVHRLWSHRSYKASLPLRIFLAFANSMAFQVIGTALHLEPSKFVLSLRRV